MKHSCKFELLDLLAARQGAAVDGGITECTQQTQKILTTHKNLYLPGVLFTSRDSSFAVVAAGSD